ncbi:MAG: ATP-dependent helicase, partial [Candidatus Thioglobus sp.]|nr:ATP-dependent helicase [Candidatus Thioglobus sp.]
GEAVSLVSADEAKQLFDIEKVIQQKLERILVDDFVPEHNLPEAGKKVLTAKNPRNNHSKKPKNRQPQNRNSEQKYKQKPKQKSKQKQGFWGKPKK